MAPNDFFSLDFCKFFLPGLQLHDHNLRKHPESGYMYMGYFFLAGNPLSIGVRLLRVFTRIARCKTPVV